MTQDSKTKPLVSVLVAAFNQERYIGRCLRSLINQNFSSENFEILVIDDGSEDKTPYALSLFEGGFGVDIKILTNQSNLGLPASINRGIRESSGKYVVRVDADDFVNANFLGFLFWFLEANEASDAVACDYLLVDDQEQVFGRESSMENPIACGLMFRKNQLVEIGMYDENFLRHEDKELRVRFEQKFTISNLEIPLYRYRRHSDNITNDIKEMDLHRKKLIRKHKGIKDL
jgi:glycosyltransferase involved in cell wall biosynthesis